MKDENTLITDLDFDEQRRYSVGTMDSPKHPPVQTDGDPAEDENGTNIPKPEST